MKITTSQLRKIIKEEIQEVEDADNNERYTISVEDPDNNERYTISVKDPDNNERYTISVKEAPMPYSVQISFGSSFSITLGDEDAQRLARLISSKATFPGA